MTIAAPVGVHLPLPFFDRIMVGIDETPESLEAAQQAAVLRAPGGTLHLVAVVQPSKAIHAGLAAPAIAEQMLNGGDRKSTRLNSSHG